MKDPFDLLANVQLLSLEIVEFLCIAPHLDKFLIEFADADFQGSVLTQERLHPLFYLGKSFFQVSHYVYLDPLSKLGTNAMVLDAWSIGSRSRYWVQPYKENGRNKVRNGESSLKRVYHVVSRCGKPLLPFTLFPLHFPLKGSFEDFKFAA